LLLRCVPFHQRRGLVYAWFAAKALVAVKAALHDPGNALWDWDLKFGNDPCHWNMVTCHEGQIQELYVLLILCIYIYGDWGVYYISVLP
jgi:hypothetical protein